ncbi:MAG: GNAT family N-acetyltransferase [Candidatus Poribacteria bacterium]|nr:GNAT family N-acetyltransferase [Candidatus Poribacteria bacterium]
MLDAAEAYFRERNLREIIAFPQDYRYSFYHLESAYLSDRLDAVHALLGFNGYKRVAGEVYLDWPNYNVAPAPVDVSVEISLQWQAGSGTRPGLIVQAHQGEKEIGICVCVSGGEYSRAEDAQDWLFTTWLGVSEEMQGQGLGRYLLHRTLQEMHGVGYRHAAISTDWQNFRAALFYSNHGYHVVDWTYALGREME